MTAETPELDRWKKTSGLVGLVAIVLTVPVVFISLTSFFQSWLVAFVFWWGIGIGSLSMSLLHQLVGGRWGNAIRPAMLAGSATLPILALLFLFLIPGFENLYPWANPERVQEDAMLAHKTPYLNWPFFVGRSIGYFVIWLIFAWAILSKTRRSAKKTSSGHHKKTLVPESIPPSMSAIGLLLTVLTVSFAAMDWIMALDPHWFSTIFGALILLGGALTALALALIMLVLAGKIPRDKDIGNDLGNLLFAFVMLWSYFSFSQYLIIWSGNLPDEADWYLDRQKGGWLYLGLFLIAFHFAVPFLILLSRRVKRHSKRLAAVAAALLAVHALEICWTILPSCESLNWTLFWAIPTSLVGIGGVCGWFYFRRLATVAHLWNPGEGHA